MHENRLSALERRVFQLESLNKNADTTEGGAPGTELTLGSTLSSSHGTVHVHARFDALNADVAEWQATLPIIEAEVDDWRSVSTTIYALGSPVRLRLLQASMSRMRAASEFASLEGIGTTGQVYHHLRILVAGGWLETTSEGGKKGFAIPASRLGHLLSILSVSIDLTERQSNI